MFLITVPRPVKLDVHLVSQLLDYVVVNSIDAARGWSDCGII